MKPFTTQRLRAWQAWTLMALLCAALYLPSLAFRYTYFDDRTLIAGQAALISGPRVLARIFSTDVFQAGTVAYRPGLVVSLLADTLIGGSRLWVYHLGNILIHLFSGWALFLLLCAIGASRLRSLLLALLFLAHPLQSQAVAWIPGRNDSLMGLWIILSLIGLVRFMQPGRWPWMVLHLVAWGCALFTKEPAALYPLAAAVYVWWRWREQDFRRLALLAGWAAVGSLWFVMRAHALEIDPGAPPMVFNLVRENVFGFAGYAGKTLFPVRMSVLPLPRSSDLLPGLAALLMYSCIFRVGRIRNARVFALGMMTLAFFMLPHTMRGTSYPNFLEHRMYVPLVGLCLMLSQLGAGAIANRHRRILAAVASGTIALFGSLTASRLPVFHDDVSLFNEVMETAPGIALPYISMASAYIERQEYDNAEVYLNKAKWLEPGNKDVYHNLGITYESTGRLAQAEQAFRYGLTLAPRSSSLHFNLGLLFQQTGRLGQAKAEYLQALASQPGNLEATVNYGMVCHLQGDLVQAVRSYRRTLAIDPWNEHACGNLGAIFRSRGQEDSAGYYFARSRRSAERARDR